MMGNLLTGITQSRDTQILLMNWADHHPYLFTMIQIAEPINWVIVAIAAFKIASGVVRAKR